MKQRQSQALDTMLRVQRFIDNNAKLLGAVDTSGSRRALDALVDVLQQHAVDQEAHRRIASAEAARTRQLRNALLINHMRPIAAVAAVNCADAPELGALSAPDSTTTPRRLIAAAGAMAKAAALYSATFVEAGLPPDFDERMLAAAQALEDSLVRRGAVVSERVAATSGLSSDVGRARKIVKVLNALIVPLLDGNDAMLAEWRAARRYPVEKRRILFPYVPNVTMVTTGSI